MFKNIRVILAIIALAIGVVGPAVVNSAHAQVVPATHSYVLTPADDQPTPTPTPNLPGTNMPCQGGGC